jgi:hypothetical protein
MFAAYRKGEGVDAIAGTEAIISHILTKKFTIPCAHAPAFSPMDPGKAFYNPLHHSYQLIISLTLRS